MIQCIMAYRENDGYRLSGEPEPEDWEELLDEVEGEPELIEHVRGQLILARKMTADDALALILTECVEHWTRNEGGPVAPKLLAQQILGSCEPDNGSR